MIMKPFWVSKMEIKMQVFILCKCGMLLQSHNYHYTVTVNYALWKTYVSKWPIPETHSPLWISLCRPVVIDSNNLYKHVAWLNIYHWNQILCQFIMIKQCCPVGKNAKIQ